MDKPTTPDAAWADFDRAAALFDKYNAEAKASSAKLRALLRKMTNKRLA